MIEQTASWLGGQLLWEAIKESPSWKRHFLANRRVVENWPERLNAEFDGRFRILCDDIEPPTIHAGGRIELQTRKLKNSAAKIKDQLLENGKPDDPHAIVSENHIYNRSNLSVSVGIMNFSEIMALRAEGQKPNILSTCSVIVCSETQEILIHHRSHDSATFPNALHVIGGSIIPPGYNTTDPDRASTLSSMQREIFEETQITVDVDDIPNIIFSEEIETGFIQVNFLGLRATKKSLARLSSNWEGDVKRVHFDNLPEILADGFWVPSGKAQILAWLALGAANGGRRPKFNGLSSEELFNKHVQ